MNKFKISMIAVIAIVMGIAASAFTDKATVKQKNSDMHYFEFTGTTNSEVGTPAKWDDLGNTTPTPPCAQSEGVVCYVEYDGDLSSFQTYISGKNLGQLQAAEIIRAYREE